MQASQMDTSSAPKAPPAAAQIDLSILIPTFHREKTVVEAVRSVLSASTLKIEVIVADDSPEGSAASAMATIVDPRVRYLVRDEPTGGFPARVRNDLVKLSSGRFLYFLDDDDTISLDTLTRIVSEMQAANVGVGIGKVCPFGPATNPVVEEERELYRKARLRFLKRPSRYEVAARLMFEPALICCSACVIRRDVFEAIGGFHTHLPLYEDVDMYIRAIRGYGYIFIDQDFLNRRTGEPSLIQNERDLRRSVESYKLMYRSYRKQYSGLEWLLLRIWAILLRRRPIDA